MLKDKAKAREKHRLRQRYQNEKEARAQKYKRQKKELQLAEKYFDYKKCKKEIHKDRKYFKERAATGLTWWRYERPGPRLFRFKKEFERLKQMNIEDISLSMSELENVIHEKLQELWECVEEVDNEVKDVTGHWKYDVDGLWKKTQKEDRDFCTSMFQNLTHHIEEEIESLHTSVLQCILDNCRKHSLNFEFQESDEELFQDMRIKNCGDGWHRIPRTVILK